MGISQEVAPIGASAGPGAAWAALHDAFDAVDEAVDQLMEAMATVGQVEAACADAGRRDHELEWLARAAGALSVRGDRVRTRCFGVVRAVRERGRASHDDDSQYVGRKTRVDGRRARRDAQLAEALGNEPPLPVGVESAQESGPGSGPERGADPAAHPVQGAEGGERPAVRPRPLAVAMDRGLVAEPQAMVVLQVLEDLPDEVDASLRWRLEEVLVEKAQRLTVRALRDAARRAVVELGVPQQEVERRQDERLRAREEAALEQSYLWMRDNGDGTWFGQFLIPELQAHMLDKMLGAMVKPVRVARRMPGEQWRDQQIEWRNERGRAFAELIGHMPSDHLSSRTAAVVLVTTDLETLRGETDRAGVTDTGAEMSAGEVRRLAAGAGILPVVMGGDSLPLDLGRKERFFTAAQRVALATRYTECAEENCDRPMSWCEVHHADPWAPVRGPDGRPARPPGRTDMANAIPLCGRHHRRLQDRSLDHWVDREEDGRAVVRFRLRAREAAPRTADGG